MKQFIAVIPLSLGTGFVFSHIPFDNFLHIGWYQFGLVMFLTLIGSMLRYCYVKSNKGEDPKAFFAVSVIVSVIVFVIYTVVSGVVSVNDSINLANEHYQINIECTMCNYHTTVDQEKGKFWGEIENENCDNCGLRLDVTKHPKYQENLEAFKSLQSGDEAKRTKK